MPKIIRILRSCSMKIFCKFPTVNISKLNFWLVICIAKNFIWTTLKVIFSIFRFFCSLRFQIYKYCPIITNHTSMKDYLFMYNSQFWPFWLVLCSRVTHVNQCKHLCLRSVSSVSRSALDLSVTRVCFLPAADGLQIRLGSGESLLLLPQASLQIFVQQVSDSVSSGPVSAQILVLQVLQLRTRVRLSKPAGDAVLTPAEAVEQIALIAQICCFSGHVLARVVEEAALISVEAFRVSLLEETRMTDTCKYVYVYVYIVHIYIYIYTHTHTYMCVYMYV